MMRPSNHLNQVYLYKPAIDFRKGIKGLSSWVAAQMDMDPFETSLFVFINRRHTALKILYWDATGFCLWHKQLDKDRFHWPEPDESTTLCWNGQQLNWLMDGCNPQQIQAHKAYRYESVI